MGLMIGVAIDLLMIAVVLEWVWEANGVHQCVPTIHMV
jgi:hypothetical protein